jgi:hypothetical protein
VSGSSEQPNGVPSLCYADRFLVSVTAQMRIASMRPVVSSVGHPRWGKIVAAFCDLHRMHHLAGSCRTEVSVLILFDEGQRQSRVFWLCVASPTPHTAMSSEGCRRQRLKLSFLHLTKFRRHSMRSIDLPTGSTYI